MAVSAAGKAGKRGQLVSAEARTGEETASPLENLIGDSTETPTLAQRDPARA